METYRAYRLNRAGRIVGGEWIEAKDDAAAAAAAHGFCDETTPTVELWLHARFIARIPCAPPAAGPDATLPTLR